MTKREFDTMAKELREAAAVLLGSKGNDYGDTNPLRNFQNVARMWSTLTRKTMTSTEVALVLLLVKLDRFANLAWPGLSSSFVGKTPCHETIRDTIIDGLNYWTLMEACRTDTSVKESDNA